MAGLSGENPIIDELGTGTETALHSTNITSSLRFHQTFRRIQELLHERQIFPRRKTGGWNIARAPW